MKKFFWCNAYRYRRVGICQPGDCVRADYVECYSYGALDGHRKTRLGGRAYHDGRCGVYVEKRK